MSFVPRLYLPSVPENQKEIVLDESAFRYLIKVLRMGQGDRFQAFDNQGRQYELALSGINDSQAHAFVLSHRETGLELEKVSLTLGQSLPKASKMDLILRQGTEVGIHRFLPILTQRSISRPEESQLGHKEKRWRKIIVEACRQCGRADLPQLDEVTSWPKVLEIFQEFDFVLLPYEKEAPTLRTVLESKLRAGKILVLVGPEGGWASQEVREAEEKGAALVHLPTPILRTETAGIIAASMLQFFYSQTLEGNP